MNNEQNFIYGNKDPIPEKGQGGQMKHTYAYDDLYRLVSANGNCIGRNSKIAAYNLVMKYDKMGRILYKKQNISQQNVQAKFHMEASL